MSVFVKNDVDAELAKLPVEYRAPNSAVCAIYISPEKKTHRIKYCLFQGDHWGSFASEIISQNDDSQPFDNLPSDCEGRSIGRPGCDLISSVSPEMMRLKNEARTIFKDFHDDDGSAAIATMGLIPYDCDEIMFAQLPVAAQEEVKQIVDAYTPYIKLHCEDTELDEDFYNCIKLAFRYPNPMAFWKIETGSTPAIIDMCIYFWVGESETDELEGEDMFLPEHQIFLPMTDKLLMTIVQDTGYIVRLLSKSMNPASPIWLKSAMVHFIGCMYVNTVKRLQTANVTDLSQSDKPKKVGKDQQKKKNARRVADAASRRYDVTTDTPESIAAKRAEAKRVYEAMVAKHEEREREEAAKLREVELARRADIQKQREQRAAAPEKSFSKSGPSHKAKDASTAPEAPDALARTKHDVKKARELESAARHAAKLKAAEEARVNAEEAKREMRTIGKAIGGC